MSINLEIYFSDFFHLSPQSIEHYGAFDISLVNDLPLFIDPFLLFNSNKPAYKKLHTEIIEYLKFLREKAKHGGIRQGLVESWYRFPEVRQTWLGFSQVGNGGRGLGKDFAEALHNSLNSIFVNFGTEQITRESHLEKLCLIRPGVGRDNVSDFTTNLIKGFLLKYTETFAIKNISRNFLATFNVEKVRFNYTTHTWENAKFTLPYYGNDYVLLTPKDILSKDETWINNSDFRNPKTFIEIANTVSNDELRAKLNDYLLRAMSENSPKGSRNEAKARKKAQQEAIARLIQQYPELIDYYIRLKEDRGKEAVAISEEKVELTEAIFIDKVRDFTTKLADNTNFYEEEYLKDTYTETHARVKFLKEVIENKGGHRIFFVNNEPLRRESDLHILFRLVWLATPSDVTREANDGRGPADFKISRGDEDKTIAEFKLASNSQLRRNLEKQTDIYQKASGAKKAVKVIIYFSK